MFFIALQYNTETQTQPNMTDSHHHVVNFYSLFELYIWPTLELPEAALFEKLNYPANDIPVCIHFWNSAAHICTSNAAAFYLVPASSGLFTSLISVLECVVPKNKIICRTQVDISHAD